MTGMLKAEVVRKVGSSGYLCRVSLPSREVKQAYDNLVSKVRARSTVSDTFLDALYAGDSGRATEEFNRHLEALSVRDSWSHQRCREHLTNYFRDHYFEPMMEAAVGNGYVDILVPETDESLRPAVMIEITTSDEAGTTDLDRIIDICWSKFGNRKYTEEDRNALFVAFAWDKRFCHIGIRSYGDFKPAESE